MMHTPIEAPDVLLRRQWAESFAFFLLEVPPALAAEMCAVHLDNLAAGMPSLDPWGDIRADAEYWADCASPAELNAYACAALRRLGTRMQGHNMRKRMMVAIWRSLTTEDRANFLRKVAVKSSGGAA